MPRAGWRRPNARPGAPTPPPPLAGGPYFEINAGPLWVEDIGNAGFDTGWGVNGEIGYAFGDGLSVGFSAGYNKSDLNVSNIFVPGEGTVSFGGELETVPLLLTVNYSFPLSGALSGYIGAGAGTLWVNGDASVSVRGETFGSVSDDEWNFALQGRAGLSYSVASNASINVGYRYLRGFFSEDDFSGHMVEGGFTIRF